MTKTNPKPTAERVRENAWDRSHATYLTGRAAIDGADALALRCERRWGAGRLRLLVSAELREKFDRQRYKFQAAICAGTLQDVIEQSSRMCAAWTALDRIAQEVAQPIILECWETVLSDGTVLAIVPDTEHAALVPKEGRAVAIVTVAEVARMFEAHLEVVKVKLSFPGATVTAVRTPTDPLEALEPTGLDTPFDDPVPNWGSQ